MQIDDRIHVRSPLGHRRGTEHGRSYSRSYNGGRNPANAHGAWSQLALLHVFGRWCVVIQGVIGGKFFGGSPGHSGYAKIAQLAGTDRLASLSSVSHFYELLFPTYAA